MDKLWAPWRIKYIQEKSKKRCIFCSRSETGKKDYILFKNQFSLCMLNIYPYNNGHLMVAPLRHVNDFQKLKDAEALDLFHAINKAKNLLKKTLKPHGFNIGINISASAGAGITGHLHVHIVPRWRGDTNFMPILYNTKIISQSLEQLYRQLKNAESKIN